MIAHRSQVTCPLKEAEAWVRATYLGTTSRPQVNFEAGGGKGGQILKKLEIMRKN